MSSELRAPMFQNSKIRYFTRLPFLFGQKLWSFGLGVSFCFSCKLRAPALCDPTCGPFWPFLTVQPLGASVLKWHFSSSSRLGNCKNVKNTLFLMRNPYRLWSFQLGAQNMSKIGSFSENTVFCDTKLNHMVFDIFRGARALICLFPFGSTVICTKVWELSAGNFHAKKNMELRTQNAQLAGCAKMVQRICRVFDKLRENYQEFGKKCELSFKTQLQKPSKSKAPVEMGLRRRYGHR